MFNPYYGNNIFPFPSNVPTATGIPHVNGTNGAQAFQMPVNSSVLLLDENNPVVYMVKTDSAGYKTIVPYKITELKPSPEIDVESLLKRIEALERKIENESYFAKNESTGDSGRRDQTIDEYRSKFEQSIFSNSSDDGFKSNLQRTFPNDSKESR